MLSKIDKNPGFLVSIIQRVKRDIDELTERMVKGQYDEDQYLESLEDIKDKIEQCRRDKRILEWLEQKTRR